MLVQIYSIFGGYQYTVDLQLPAYSGSAATSTVDLQLPAYSDLQLPAYSGSAATSIQWILSYLSCLGPEGAGPLEIACVSEICIFTRC